MDHLQYCDAVTEEIGRFAAAVRGVDPSLNVVTCPGWDIAGLIEHAGTVHRWAAAMVRERTLTRLERRNLDIGLPEDKGAYADWLASGAALLTGALRAAPPDAEMWAWGADHHVRFWSRRMLFETAVHRADAELSLGHAPSIDPALAADGIDELLDNLPHAAYFAPQVKELRGDGESLHWHATDADGEWTIILSPDGFTWRHGHHKASVAVRGPASDLLLMAYGRQSPDGERLEWFGDRPLLGRWLANSAL